VRGIGRKLQPGASWRAGGAMRCPVAEATALPLSKIKIQMRPVFGRAAKVKNRT